MARDQDTTLGGTDRSFPATSLGLTASLRGALGEEMRVAINTVAERYWKAIYFFLRFARRSSNEETKDLVQSFFAWLLEKGALSQFDPGKGTFRAFLKGVLRNFVGNEIQAAQRLKRGGGVAILSLDVDDGLAAAMSAAVDGDAERAFDRAWMNEVISRAVQAVRSAYERRGDGKRFALFEEYDLAAESARPTYAQLAERFGMKATDVQNHLRAAREEVRTQARLEVGEMSGNPAMLDEEWNAFLGA